MLMASVSADQSSPVQCMQVHICLHDPLMICLLTNFQCWPSVAVDLRTLEKAEDTCEDVANVLTPGRKEDAQTCGSQVSLDGSKSWGYQKLGLPRPILPAAQAGLMPEYALLFLVVSSCGATSCGWAGPGQLTYLVDIMGK